MPIWQPVRPFSISYIFTPPMFKEREDKRAMMTSATDIFKELERNSNDLQYEEASAMLADLSYVLIPFDH